MKKVNLCVLAGLLLAGLPLAATAQDAEPGPAQPPVVEPWSMTWTEPEFEAIAGALVGNWQTTGEVAEFGNPDESAVVVMSICPARLTELPDALYIECARADSLGKPYRSAFLQLYRRQGAIRLRTLEVRGAGNPILNLLAGLWATPDFLPDIARDELIATLDLELVKAGAGWVGETPYPYPTAVGGAVEMTSRMKITADRIETADRGFAADGGVLWGPGEGENYVFERIDAPFSVERRENGLVIITINEDSSTVVPEPGDRVAFAYSGWLTTGRLFDTSRHANRQPLEYTLPGSLIPGWMMATKDMSERDWRKFIVPSALGYGPSSAAGGAIPPDSTLVFEAECVGVTDGPPLPEVQPAPGGQQ